MGCDDGRGVPLLGHGELRRLPPETLPVRCRSAADPPDALHHIVRAGYPVALWRREPVASATVCADFHRGVTRALREAGTASRFPAALRAAAADGIPEAYWSQHLALFYDDPTRPLPGSEELMEVP